MSDSLVIIPTYNERENIADIVTAVMKQPTLFDLLVVDDDSPDGTANLVESMQVEYKGRLHLEKYPGKQGVGTAYVHGFRWALARDYEYIFEMDADFSHNPEDLNKLYQACCHSGNEMAIGSRYISGVNVVNWPISRVMLSYFASFYVRFITGMPIADTTAGFKCYKRSVLETIDLTRVRFTGYAFQIEMKFLAWKYGFTIAEVPIIFTDRTKGKSKMNGGIIKEALLGVIQIKINSFFKSYRKPKEMLNVEC